MAIKLGVRWPDFQVPIERGVVREFIEVVDELGYDHVTCFDHLAGMSPRTRRGWRTDYTTDIEWAESFSLLSFMAGLSDRLGFMTAILGLPLRPTFLVAKQAATLDRMTEGRLRIGVGISWNEIEFSLMGQDFENRAVRMEEQIEVLRALWTKKEVVFRGKWHHLPFVGLSLAPVQQPIPIWMAVADSPKQVLRRVGRYADGILPLWNPDDAAHDRLEFIKNEMKENGRDPSTLGFEAYVEVGPRWQDNPTAEPAKPRTDEEMAKDIRAWVEMGATHIEFRTRSCGLPNMEAQLREIRRFKQVADSILG